MGRSNGRSKDDTTSEQKRDAQGDRGEPEEPNTRDSARSGVRAAPPMGERVKAALEASARTEATLADLVRAAKFMNATIGTVRAANTALARELESVGAILSGAGEEPSALAGRIERLERVLDAADQDAARERERLMAERDKFIAMLLADHEREVESLRQRLADLEADSKREPATSSSDPPN
jgi:hypothetical protein